MCCRCSGWALGGSGLSWPHSHWGPTQLGRFKTVKQSQRQVPERMKLSPIQSIQFCYSQTTLRQTCYSKNIYWPPARTGFGLLCASISQCVGTVLLTVKMLSSNPGLYPLDARNTNPCPSYDDENCFLMLPNVPSGAIHPQLRTTALCQDSNSQTSVNTRLT